MSLRAAVSVVVWCAVGAPSSPVTVTAASAASAAPLPPPPLPSGWASGWIEGRPYYYRVSDPGNVFWELPPGAARSPGTPAAPSTTQAGVEMPSPQPSSPMPSPLPPPPPPQQSAPPRPVSDLDRFLMGCAEADDQLIGQLVRERRVHPSDRDERGYSCLHVAASLDRCHPCHPAAPPMASLARSPRQLLPAALRRCMLCRARSREAAYRSPALLSGWASCGGCSTSMGSAHPTRWTKRCGGRCVLFGGRFD
jgi:hypothetical protein